MHIPLKKNHRWFIWGGALLALLLLGLFPLLGRPVFSPAVYGSSVSGNKTDSDTPTDQEIYALILFRERLPKTMTAFIAGAGLALAGLALQTLFRNPLASPYTLGIASGAAFGACFWLVLGGGLTALFGIPLVVWSSGSGACFSALLLLLLWRWKGLSTDQLLLAGIALSFFFSSLILGFQYAADPGRAFWMLRWTMGRIEALSWESLLAYFSLILLSGAILFYYGRDLDLFLMGTDRAIALGVPVTRIKLCLLMISSLLVGTIVSVCGPIGFVGLMSPHFCRLLVGGDHRRLIPATLFFGGFFLAACFTLSRSIFAGDVLPVGIVTSILGGPFFLWLMLRGK